MAKEKKSINIEIGKRLQSIRKSSGYTQEEFAESLDVCVEHYRKLENGTYGLMPSKVMILYELYKIDPTYLITGENNQSFDFDLYMASCDIKEKNNFIERMLTYMGKLMIKEE